MLRPNERIRALRPVVHGGRDFAELRELGISPEQVLDFSVSTNPFGPPPGMQDVLAGVPIDCYPDSESTELTDLLAESLGVPAGRIMVGAGSTELIRLVSMCYLGSGDRALIPGPTYGEYEAACLLEGAEVIKYEVSEKKGFRLDAAGIAGRIKKDRPKAVFLCNPNNPTGQYISRAEFESVLAAAGETLVVLDEAYAAFVEDRWPSTDLSGKSNLIILRSMTKDYALAGLRLGYAVACEDIVRILKRARPPWNVSTVAQAAGVHALRSQNYVADCAAKVKEAKSYLLCELKALGFQTIPSQANFFLIRVGDGADFRQQLLKRGILVRDCASFGLPGYARIAARRKFECERLIEAVKDVLKVRDLK